MLLAHGNAGSPHFSFQLFGTLLIGFLGPKWFVQSRATRRQDAVIAELPMFVNLLRILQGVGLSLDQSLQVIVSDFRSTLPVLAQELQIAQAQLRPAAPANRR